MYYLRYCSPMGWLLLLSDGRYLTHLLMVESIPEEAVSGEDVPVLQKTKTWLDGYFRGETSVLDIPMAPKGTPFQQQVWQLLLDIGYGQTRTYGDLAREMARKMGKETMSAQAVGQAVGKNPISIAIPCHRCVGAKGQMTGYEWGLDKKIWLLQHEGLRIEKNKMQGIKE